MASASLSSMAAGTAQYNEYFANLSIPSVIYEVSEDTIRIVDLNEASAALRGLERKTMIGMDAHSAFEHVEYGGLLDAIRRVWRSGEAENFILNWISDDGDARWLENTIFVVGENQVGTVYHEITREKQLENTLQRAGKFEALGTMAGGIAHNFNNILYIILGYARLAGDDLAEDDPAASSVEEIIRAGERGSQLVQQMLAFSRRAGAERQAIEPVTVIRDIEALLRMSLVPGVKLDLHLEGACGSIKADVGLVQQAIMSVCLNAFDALAADGGTVSIRLDEVIGAEVPRERMHGTPQPGYARISVQDDGPGIDAEVVDRVFEPFFTTKGPESGSGLGLAAVLGIVETHEGTISLRSEIGGGTVVDLYFPLLDTIARVKEDAPVTAAPKARILFVDDEPMIAKLGDAVLSREGHSVDAFTNPEEALAALTADPEAYGLVVTDHNMPQMKGRELIESILKVAPGMSAIVMSGMGSDFCEEEGTAPGVVATIAKPIDIHEMVSIVETALTTAKGD